MANQGRTTVDVTRSGRKVFVEHRKKPQKTKNAGGWHIRMAISSTYHVSMTKSEAHHLAYVLLSYAKTLPKLPKNSN
jgi:hypothetical protein